MSACARSASGSVQCQRTPASTSKVGWRWSWTESTSRRTRATRSPSSTTAAVACAVTATPAASTVSAQRRSSRRRASDSRRSASARWMVASPLRTAVETGIACGGPAAVERTATVPSGHSGSIGGDAVLPQVLEVERPQQLADLALAGVGHVIDVGAQVHDIVLGLLVLAGGPLLPTRAHYAA